VFSLRKRSLLLWELVGDFLALAVKVAVTIKSHGAVSFAHTPATIDAGLCR
jgi:hypothetical protein